MREIGTILTSSPLRQINATIIIILIVIDTTKIAIVQIIYNLLIIWTNQSIYTLCLLSSKLCKTELLPLFQLAEIVKLSVLALAL